MIDFNNQLVKNNNSNTQILEHERNATKSEMQDNEISHHENSQKYQQDRSVMNEDEEHHVWTKARQGQNITGFFVTNKTQ